MAVANAGRGGSDLDLQDEEELLLIISGMGEHLQAEKRYMIGAECKDCISDLQRYLRRDDPMSLAAHRALGSWRVLQTHLVPLLQATGDSDTKLAFNCLKVIVKLTMKPEQLAMRIYDHLKEKKDPDPAYGARLTELKRYHRAYKRAFIKADAMGSVVWLLGRALSVPEDVRSDDEEMMIELLLTLVLNLLHTTHPDETPPDPGDASNHIADRETLRALLSAMDGEHVLETLLYVLQQVEESPTYRNFNLNLLEISYYVLSAHTPGELFAKDEEASALTKENIKAAEKKVEGGGGAGTSAEGAAETAEAEAVDVDVEAEAEAEAEAGGKKPEGETPQPRTGSGSRTLHNGGKRGALGSHLAHQRHQLNTLNATRPSRHGNFGGAFKVNTVFGTQHVSHRLNNSGEAELPQAQRKRTVRNKMPISAPIELRRDYKSETLLRGFVEGLFSGPFNALMSTVVKDLQGFAFGSNAFNAGKVLMQDHTFFAATASWVLHAHILRQQAIMEEEPDKKFDVGPVGALADATVFGLATRLSRELLEKKAWLPLCVFVGLLRQLFAFLDQMVASGDEEVQIAAAQIQKQIYYEMQILELLKGLIEAYEPHHMPPGFMADCAIMTHVVLRHLEGISDGGGVVLKKKKQQAKRKKKGGPVQLDENGLPIENAIEPVEQGEDDDADAAEEARRQAVEEISLDFEHELYKFAGNREIVTRYIGLLRNFEHVPPRAVYCALKLISMLVKKCNLEAMLYQLSTLHTISTILDNPVAKQPQHKDMYATCRWIARRFFSLAEQNSALFVECLVWKRANECEQVANGYTNRTMKTAKGLPNEVNLPTVDEEGNVINGDLEGMVGGDGYEIDYDGLDMSGGGVMGSGGSGGGGGGGGEDDLEAAARGFEADSGAALFAELHRASNGKANKDDYFDDFIGWDVASMRGDLASYYKEAANREEEDGDGASAPILRPAKRGKKKMAAAQEAEMEEANQGGSEPPSLPPSLPPSEPPSLPPSDDEGDGGNAMADEEEDLDMSGGGVMGGGNEEVLGGGSASAKRKLPAAAEEEEEADPVASRLASVKAALENVRAAHSKGKEKASPVVEAASPAAPTPESAAKPQPAKQAKRRQIVEDSDED